MKRGEGQANSAPLHELPTLTAGDFSRLSSFIEAELGIRMPESKRVMLESRLVKRLRQLSLRDFPSYIEYVFSEEGRASELINMIDAVTTNKTDFFREADHFEFLLSRILPAYSRERRPEPRRFWSAGCSTGEEPYTLAMVLEEYRTKDPAFAYTIFASDLSTQALAKAEEAVYPESQAEPVPMSFKKRHFLRSRNHAQGLVRIKPELRSKVSFARLNFMDEHYPVEYSFDVVLCRNVIIYFERRVQERILERILRHLRPGGWLLVGHSETLAGMPLPIRSVAPTIYVKE